MDSSFSLEAWQGLGGMHRFDGHAVFAARRGAQGAPPLVLIHGFPTASWDWHKLWLALVGRFDCLAPDLLGFGFSAKPCWRQYSILEQADLVESLADAAGFERYQVLAHDYGDTVAQELLARDAERAARGEARRLKRVCLLNGGLFPEVHRPRPVQTLLAGPLGWLVVRLLTERAFRHSMRQIFGAQTPPSEAELATFWTLARHNGGLRVYHRLIRYMAERRTHRDRWVGALIDAAVPLRFINGAQDPVSGWHMAERYRELLPSADIRTLDCGHYPQLEAPQECLQAILEFLDAD